MRRIGLVTNKDKDSDFRYTKLIVEELLKKGFTAVVSSEISSSINLPAVESESVYKESDFIICVGGDGTFLKTARQAFVYKKPVLGINKGTVGFLAEVETHDIEWAIDRLSKGEYDIQQRMVINVEVIRQGKKVFEDAAINDAVVSRMALSRILRLRVLLDDTYVESFPGDGIIISTPTGSTGYSLSAGGPIVETDMRLMTITPICPHMLYSRSYIASEMRTVKVSIDDCCEVKAMLTLDGQEGFALLPGDLVSVRTSGDNALFASLRHVNFYDVLRAKIQCRTN